MLGSRWAEQVNNSVAGWRLYDGIFKQNAMAFSLLKFLSSAINEVKETFCFTEINSFATIHEDDTMYAA